MRIKLHKYREFMARDVGFSNVCNRRVCARRMIDCIRKRIIVWDVDHGIM